MRITLQKQETCSGKTSLTNSQEQKCAFCRKHKGVILIRDSNHITYWICEACDSSMTWKVK